MNWRPAVAPAALAVATLAAPTAAQESESAEPWRLGAAASAPEWLTLSGSFRTRYESLDNQFRPGLTGSDQLVSLRTTLFAEGRFEPFRLGVEVFDSRAYGGDEGGAAGTGEVNVFEPVQAYVGAAFEDTLGAGSSTDVLAGRFTLDLGSRRLVGRNNFRNATNAFTGLKLDHTFADESKLTAFYTLPQNRLPSDKAAILDNDFELDEESEDLQFWGLFYARAGLPLESSGELFVFGLKEEDGDLETRNRDIITPGLRVFRDPDAGAWDYEIEAGYQFGEARGSSSPADVTDLDVSAYYAHLEVGRTFDAPWSPRVAFEWDIASGDEDPGDDEINRFDSLFGPRRPDFGPTGIYGPLGRSNINSPGVRVEAKPSARWDGFVSYRALWLDEPRDSFANTGVRDSSGASGDFAGHQIEARARYWLVPDSVRLDVGAATLIDGEFLQDAPNATGEGDTLYGYADITWTF